MTRGGRAIPASRQTMWPTCLPRNPDSKVQADGHSKETSGTGLPEADLWHLPASIKHPVDVLQASGTKSPGSVDLEECDVIHVYCCGPRIWIVTTHV
jgi:hypothetical protein